MIFFRIKTLVEADKNSTSCYCRQLMATPGEFDLLVSSKIIMLDTEQNLPLKMVSRFFIIVL